MEGYDTIQFIEILNTIPSVRHLRDEEEEGLYVSFYQGVKGNLVLIDRSDEFINRRTHISYLDQLGLTELITSFYPDFTF